ncbi:beta-galactosidase [Puia dinghuensis]|uniref:Beta-galactosidase n=2 Tax=Puia dinghuensis TaxID=1792502 RepID=A0A8J2U6H6_9BACT|nr:beta-galactosidase [Puia dinghuensis]
MNIRIGIILCLLTCFDMKGMAQHPRERINFNRDWLFQLGDHPGAEGMRYDDAGWERIGLPHSFSTPYFMSPQFYMGYGWYRKHFTIEKAGDGRHWSLEFEAAFQDAEVFVNGQRVGRHQGGYTGFTIDITDALRQGDNLVAVRLNNLWNPRLAPRAGEHTFSGGLYRDVYLVGTGAVHVAWCGSYITTPEISAAHARVRVQAEVTNHLDSACEVEVRTLVVDAVGRGVARFVQKQQLAPGETRNIDQSGLLRCRARLWSPENPYRYRAVISLYVGGRKADEYITPFGIRSIRWSADSGFFLNGRHVYLRGANVHQDHAGWGDAVTNAGFYRDVRLMKEAGFNFIRGSHYPHDPAFYDACDSLGMLCWSENPFWGIGGSDNTPEGSWNSSAYPTIAADQGPFEESVHQELEEMIRIQRNHPSVIIWSLSNEPFFTAPATLQKAKRLLKTLVNIANTCDPTRPAAIGGAQRPLDSNRIDKIGQVAGYNGDGGALPIFRDPGIPSVVAEYGSVSAKRPGNYAPGWGDLAVDSGHAVHPWRAGQAVWCGFDHGSIAGGQLGEMGIVDYFRIPKRAWYWYRAHYRNIPPPEWPREGVAAGLRLEVDKQSASTDGTDDIRIMVTVVNADGRQVSNSPPVDLEVLSGPGVFPTGRRIHFAPGSDIAIADGQSAIECRAWYAGDCRIVASSPGLTSTSTTIRFTGAIPYRPGITLQNNGNPYIKFTGERPDTAMRHFGRNNPTFASSAAAGHSPGFAADGDPLTYWCPLTEDSAAWWMLDMEKSVEVDSIVVDAETADDCPYEIEIGLNGHWTPLDDVKDARARRTIPVAAMPGRYVRIKFQGRCKARLSEVIVSGRILP